MRSLVVGTGSFAPEKVVTNAELEKLVDTSDQWIQERTGIKERRMAAPEQASSDLALVAATRALEMAGLAAAEVECLVVGTITPDYPFPSTACLVQRKIGAGLWNMGERKLAIERYQKGINLLKDGPPCLELVRLYEEAASLYMHAGDNMLAIYASEKALRLAEKLGETRVASRAHGIFGRVFGRIGDTAKARENLERLPPSSSSSKNR